MVRWLMNSEIIKVIKKGTEPKNVSVWNTPAVNEGNKLFIPVWIASLCAKA
jgi:hypothetical protein